MNTTVKSEEERCKEAREEEDRDAFDTYLIAQRLQEKLDAKKTMDEEKTFNEIN